MYIRVIIIFRNFIRSLGICEPLFAFLSVIRLVSILQSFTRSSVYRRSTISC